MSRARLLRALLLVLALPGGASASSRGERRISVPDATPEELALFADVRDDKLDAHDPVTAALAAIGTTPEAREKATARWKEFLTSLAAEGKDKPAKEKAQLVLARLHGKLLVKSYDFFQNDMSVLLLEGRYNCVTSAIAFQAAGAALGLDVRGVLVPSHVYVRVVADGVAYDVETTSPAGFLLTQDDVAYARFLEKMQLDTEKKSGRKIVTGEKFTRREIDPIGMLALLYANRGAIAVEGGRQKEAIGHFARMALLAEDARYARDSRDLLLAQAAEKQIQEKDYDEARRLLKFAIGDPGGDPIIRKRLSENIGYTWEIEAQEHLDAKRYESAFASLVAARQWTDDPAVPHNLKATLNVWGLDELEAKRFEKAADVFYRAITSFPEDADFPQNLLVVYYEWTQALLAQGSYDQALDRARRVVRVLPDEKSAREIFADAASRYGEKLGNEGNWAAALPILEEAWSIAPNDYVKEDLVVTLTNAGVAWAKAGDKARAEAAWKRALEVDPDASVARTNLERLTRR